jgi:monoamine oxidase
MVVNWFQDPFAKGSYRAQKVGSSYSEFDAQNISNPCLVKFSTILFDEKKVPLIFAGEHMALDSGFMDSALKTGKAAGKIILKYLKK